MPQRQLSKWFRCRSATLLAFLLTLGLLAGSVSGGQYTTFTLPGTATGSGTGAPTDVPYWTGAADGGLSNEEDLSALATGLVINTAGVPSAYTGAGCTNQVIEDLDASGAPSCVSITGAYIAATLDLSSKILRIPNSTSLPGTCTVGDAYMDTNATTGQRFYLCESTNTWALQGDGGGGGAGDIESVGDCTTGACATVGGLRLNPRVTALSSGTTFTCPGDTSDQCSMVNTEGAGTLIVAAPTGTPVNGQWLALLLQCTSGEQTYSFNSIFAAAPGIPLPTTCPADSTLNLYNFRYSTITSKWVITGDTSAATATGDLTASGPLSASATRQVLGGALTLSCPTCTTNASALTANLPVIGGGGQATAVGTRSGNTTAYVTTTGAQTNGDCVQIDANGNHVASGAACGGAVSGVTLQEADGTPSIANVVTIKVTNGTLTDEGSGVGLVTTGGGGASLTYDTGTDADTAMAVNTVYVVDMSAWATADRTYTLPASCTVGNVIGVIISAGDASHELLLTAAASDTLNGVAGGTEWSRLFITGERVEMTCVTTDSAWIVTTDGRIPMRGLIELTTQADGGAANTYTRPTQATSAGAWTERIDVGDIGDVTNDALVSRRAADIVITMGFQTKDTPTTGQAFGARAFNGTTEIFSSFTTANAGNLHRMTTSRPYRSTAGESISFWFRNQEADIGQAASSSVFLSIVEVLKP